MTAPKDAKGHPEPVANSPNYTLRRSALHDTRPAFTIKGGRMSARPRTIICKHLRKLVRFAMLPIGDYLNRSLTHKSQILCRKLHPCSGPATWRRAETQAIYGRQTS